MRTLSLIVAVVTIVLAVVVAAPRPAAAGLLKPGDPFPAWALRDHAGKDVTSAALAGKRYLLWFYPKAETPGCTAEGRGLRDRADAFRRQGVEILGVSFDEPAANAAFVAAEGFPFRLLSDTDRTLARAVGAAPDDARASARRISYLVGADGRVQRAYDAVTPATHADDVLRDLAEAP